MYFRAAIKVTCFKIFMTYILNLWVKVYTFLLKLLFFSLLHGRGVWIYFFVGLFIIKLWKYHTFIIVFWENYGSHLSASLISMFLSFFKLLIATQRLLFGVFCKSGKFRLFWTILIETMFWSNFLSLFLGGLNANLFFVIELSEDISSCDSFSL